MTTTIVSNDVDAMERMVVEVLQSAFHIKRHVSGEGSLIFVDEDMSPDTIGPNRMPWSRNVWRFTPKEFRQCLLDAAKKGVGV